jgi:hypothetical protein
MDLQNREEGKKRKSKLKQVEKKGRRHRAKRRRQTKTENKGKGLEQTNTDRPNSTPSTSLQLLHLSPGLLFSFCMHFLVVCVTVQVKFNSLEQ